MEFYQQGPILANQYTTDNVLRSFLKRTLPPEMFTEIEPDLENFGERAANEILAMGDIAENNPPQLIQFDPWGRRIDSIQVSPGWQQLNEVSATEGLIAIGYKRKYNEFSRIYQFAKLYLFHPSSSVYTCPLAMTDGAARLLEVYGDSQLKANALSRLTSRNPKDFWTSGQWMTERTGGSDVSGTQTIAQRQANTDYKLYGDKWFTSASTSQMTITLARIEEEGKTVPGSKGLSMFYLELRDKGGKLNNIAVHRLKDKLGTKAVPTAELTLSGSNARLVGEKGRGIKTIATILNITRIYNSICAVATMRRGIALALDYSTRRQAFGKSLIDHSLHKETLAHLQVEYTGAFYLVFYIIGLLGKEECATASEEEKSLLRMLTPLAKLYTAKQAIAVTSEVLESFGGAGYVEDTGLPKMLRDAQVLSIWEGTTNVLSLDVLRAIAKENVFLPFLENIHQRLAIVNRDIFAAELSQIENACKKIQSFLTDTNDQELVQVNARNFAYSLAQTFIASLLLENAQRDILENSSHGFNKIAAKRWCQKALVTSFLDNEHMDETNILLAMRETY